MEKIKFLIIDSEKLIDDSISLTLPDIVEFTMIMVIGSVSKVSFNQNTHLVIGLALSLWVAWFMQRKLLTPLGAFLFALLSISVGFSKVFFLQ